MIVTHNSSPFIEACLRSLPRGPRIQVIVVDNGSRDGTADLVRRAFRGIRVVEQGNVGFGRGCNRGVQEAIGDVLVFLNPDTRVEDRWLESLVDGLAPGRIHTSQLIDDDGSRRVQALGLTLHYSGLATLNGRGAQLRTGAPFEVPGFSGASFAMVRSDFEELGGFDPRFFLYVEDVELAWRARRAGFRIFAVPTSVVAHRPAGRITPAKLQHIQCGRQILLEKHLTLATRRRLAPALLMIRFAEWLVGARQAVAQQVPLANTPLRSRPDWLRATVPLQSLPRPARIFFAFANPLLAANALLWRR